ncbi:MAG: glycosyltransferase family 9 protein [Nitrospina sp.]|jgi:heptosyltransferase II|nr:glycosyltransferase family 9 protein [Nitrospina sp.]MBT6601434.1 glycosyltransferase family 9 protein [Nitrospina sp.]
MAELARKLERNAKYILWAIIGLFVSKKKPPPLPINFTALTSVLVIRPDRLGDVVLSTPVYESIKKSFPHLHLSVVVSQDNVPILIGNPNIDKIIPFEPKNIGTAIKQLRNTKFDIAFTLNKKFSAIASILSLISKAKYKISYAHDETAWLYDIRLPLDNQLRHESLNNLELLNYVGLPSITKSPCLYFNKDEEKKITIMLNALRKYPKRPLVLIKPGTRIEQWGWKEGNFRIVAEKLSSLKQAEVLFICGPGEEPLINRINKQANPKIGQLPILSIKELALVIKKSDLLFCNHTGIMHFASAVETPAVVIFKHGEVSRWGPISIPHIVLEEKNSDTLSPEIVLKKINQLLANTTKNNKTI